MATYKVTRSSYLLEESGQSRTFDVEADGFRYHSIDNADIFVEFYDESDEIVEAVNINTIERISKK